jgi:glycosyltransferase involved in cell wall biosynthesis
MIKLNITTQIKTLCILSLGFGLVVNGFEKRPSTNTNCIKEKPFVIIVASYNNKRWYTNNLDSITRQDYKNYRIIYTNDASTDGTGTFVEKYIKLNKCQHITLIHNNNRLGAMANVDHMIRDLCAPHEIVVFVDGDDWLAHNQVLNYLNRFYEGPVWLTYGQFTYYPSGSPGFAEEIPADIISTNSFRLRGHSFTHLKTCYAALYQRIQKTDLILDGKFLPMTYDVAVMLPILEMAGHHSRFISEVLYIYNSANMINDHKVDKNLQYSLDQMIRKRLPYKPLYSLDLTTSQQSRRQ